MGQKKRYNLYLELDLIHKLENEAKKHNVSTSEYIRTILKESLSLVRYDTEKKMDELVKKIIESESFKKAVKEGQDKAFKDLGLKTS